MPAFSAHDGTGLAYHLFGAGLPVICLPGGPMQDSAYRFVATVAAFLG
jgi:proline iminopeptidase